MMELMLQGLFVYVDQKCISPYLPTPPLGPEMTPGQF